MSEPRWPAVIFDLDGTLVDTIPLIIASYRHAFREVLDRDIPEERIRGWIGRPLIEAMREEEPQRAAELHAVYTRWNLEHTEELLQTFPGTGELLGSLREAGVAVGVATSKPREPAQLALRLSGLAGLVEVHAALEDTTAHKPDPEPIRFACARMGVDPADAVYVGDATVDLQAGRAAGTSTVAVTWGAGREPDLASENPDAIAHNVEQLQQILLPGE